jgi:hypothetical protein
VIDQEVYSNDGLNISSDPRQNAVSRVFWIPMIPSNIDHCLALAFTKRKRDLLICPFLILAEAHWKT